MITVGYGDVTPANKYEMVLGIFTMLFACGVFGFSINKIGIIIQDMQK
jgi:hypothetical protein